MTDFDFNDLAEKSSKHVKPRGLVLSCGTAGFRTVATDLDHIFFRVGILATLRARYKNAVIGVMATASHNPIQDNGVKIIDPHGEMLEITWEKYATKLGNADNDTVLDTVKEIIKECDIDLSIPALIFIGKDTRPSSIELCNSLKAGITTIGGNFKDFGLLTTPQLHFIVNRQNTTSTSPTEESYYKEFCTSFINTIGDVKSTEKPEVIVDCANGVGALKLKVVKEKLADYLTIDIVDDGSGELNKNCGADFVKVQQKPPHGQELIKNKHFVSFDGDADRIIYYTKNESGEFVLLDGDKMASLIAIYFQESFSALNIDVKVGVIQTAYANGSSTKFIEEKLKIEVACTKTGVKHLHHRAQEYDVGIYFEPNGHGTVLIQNSVIDEINKAAKQNGKEMLATQLNNVISIINQTVGDSICDMLLIEAILIIKQWSILQWSSIYRELPNRQLKVKVKDRLAITTANEERMVVKPDGLQDCINECVKRYPSGRSFVRPSGTEDVVRVYSESDTQENADKLGKEISDAVNRFL